MKVRITRSGGFAGIASTREFHLSHAEVAQLRESAAALVHVADGYLYEIETGDDTFTVPDSDALASLFR